MHFVDLKNEKVVHPASLTPSKLDYLDNNALGRHKDQMSGESQLQSVLRHSALSVYGITEADGKQ